MYECSRSWRISLTASAAAAEWRFEIPSATTTALSNPHDTLARMGAFGADILSNLRPHLALRKMTP